MDHDIEQIKEIEQKTPEVIGKFIASLKNARRKETDETVIEAIDEAVERIQSNALDFYKRPLYDPELMDLYKELDDMLLELGITCFKVGEVDAKTEIEKDAEEILNEVIEEAKKDAKDEAHSEEKREEENENADEHVYDLFSKVVTLDYDGKKIDTSNLSLYQKAKAISRANREKITVDDKAIQEIYSRYEKNIANKIDTFPQSVKDELTKKYGTGFKDVLISSYKQGFMEQMGKELDNAYTEGIELRNRDIVKQMTFDNKVSEITLLESTDVDEIEVTNDEDKKIKEELTKLNNSVRDKDIFTYRESTKKLFNILKEKTTHLSQAEQKNILSQASPLFKQAFNLYIQSGKYLEDQTEIKQEEEEKINNTK